MGYNILYVEDNVLNCRLVRKLVQGFGYDIVEANSGWNGLALAQQFLPHLILLDINLPDLNGEQVLLQLRTIPQVAQIPVVAITANAMYGDREHYLEVGFNGYIAKPIARLELKNLLDHFLVAEAV
jgi:CheY-like chemotaxis protein